MKKYFAVLMVMMALFSTASIKAQDAPKVERPKPLTATLVGVCENRLQKLMVAVFTYDNGKVLVVDGKNMQGFESAEAIVQYAATASAIGEYAQKCGDTST